MSDSDSFKFYFLDSDSKELGVRRFALPVANSSNFTFVMEKLSEMYPTFAETPSQFYWIDEENDKILVSSKQDWSTALASMKGVNLKKFYVKVLSSEKGSQPTDSGKSSEAHPGVICDVCTNNIVGFRYKCIVCRNYDLCSSCEQLALHPEHPMLRIPTACLFERKDLRLLVHSLGSFMSSALESHFSKKHHENCSEYGKKKRRSDKHESGSDNDDSKENCHKKRHGHKSKKMGCNYSQMFNDFLNNFDPHILGAEAFFGEFPKPDDNANGDTTQAPPHAEYLKAIGKTLASMLDPLGVDVDFDIRSKNQEKEKKTEDPKPESPTSSSNPSTPPQKEVRFAAPEKDQEPMKEKIDRISKSLANQKLKESPEKDDWISFEELQRDAGEENPKEPPKTSQPQESSKLASAPPQESQTLYPSLQTAKALQNPIIREALEKMLSMGFTNDGGWLTHLLEAKAGDINQALEVLAPHKKN